MSPPSFSHLWEQLTSVQHPPTEAELFLALVGGFFLSLPPIWHWSRNLITVAHEGGHALVAVLFGRRLAGIKLHSDTSGLTVSRGKPRGLGMIATLVAGYPAPAGIGLGLAWLLAQGRVVATLLLLAALSALMLLMIRNFWGALVVAPLAFLLYWTTQELSPQLQRFLLALSVFFLIIGALRSLIELQQHRQAGDAEGSDVEQLQKLTLIPAVLWLGLCALLSVASAYGAYLLLFT